MSPVIRIVAFEFAGGDAFFWGLALLTAAARSGSCATLRASALIAG